MNSTVEFRDNTDLESDKAGPSGTPDLILLSADVFHGTGVWSDTGDGGVPVRWRKGRAVGPVTSARSRRPRAHPFPWNHVRRLRPKNARAASCDRRFSHPAVSGQESARNSRTISLPPGAAQEAAPRWARSAHRVVRVGQSRGPRRSPNGIGRSRGAYAFILLGRRAVTARSPAMRALSRRMAPRHSPGWSMAGADTARLGGSPGEIGRASCTAPPPWPR